MNSWEICEFGQKVSYQPSFYIGCNGRNTILLGLGIMVGWEIDHEILILTRPNYYQNEEMLLKRGMRSWHLNLVDTESLRSTVVCCSLFMLAVILWGSYASVS